MKKRKDRVVFYSKGDMTIGYELNKIQELLTNINVNDDFNINDFLEFYSIKQYFDNKLFVIDGNDVLQKEYTELSNKLLKKTAQYFNQNIDSINIKEIINKIEFHYTELFYCLFNKYKLYKKIEFNIIIDILGKKPYLIKYLLKYKSIVNYYDTDIKSFVESYDKTTELFLNKLNGDKLYFPKSLTIEDKENIVLRYIEQDGRENMNKLEHISKLRNSDFLKLSKKTILLAKKKHEKSIKDFFKGNTGIKHGYTVGLSETQKKDVLVENTNPLEPKIIYSINLFNSLYENKGISYLFRNIFNYLDDRGNIELINKESEISVLMELFTSNIAGEYQTGSQFQFKEAFSILNLVTLINYLKENHSKKTSSIIEYFKINLSLYQGFEKVIFRTNSLDKIEDYGDMLKIIIPECDLFIKQFICYVKEGEIDFELIGLQDGFEYESIPSLLEKKYFYEKDEKLKDLKYYFFSDQSGLFYIEGFERKYKNFYGLISNENLKLNNFHNYQVNILESLIKENILYIDENDFIRIKNKVFIFLVGEIHKKGVISYYGYNDLIQKEILGMENLGYLYFESRLLSKLESSYFNYYLNDRVFTNSYGIRNKNMHGYYYLDENSAYNDFMVIIRLIILMFLKIEDELYIVDRMKKFK